MLQGINHEAEDFQGGCSQEKFALVRREIYGAGPDFVRSLYLNSCLPNCPVSLLPIGELYGNVVIGRDVEVAKYLCGQGCMNEACVNQDIRNRGHFAAVLVSHQDVDEYLPQDMLPNAYGYA